MSSTTSPAAGAINDLWGAPTWIVPGEMSVAALVLARGGYTAQARAACAYLVRIQNPDGSWNNQYSGTVATDSARYARNTAQPMIALGVLGGYGGALTAAHGWLAALEDPAVKHGADDGLVGGGFDAGGAVLEDRWTSDNAWAALAFEAAGDLAARDRVVAGINGLLVTGDHWVQRIDKNGVTTDGTYGWINFAPAFAGLARMGAAYPAGLAAGMRARLQEAAGPAAGAVREFADGDRYMPGIGFQASLAWNALGATAFTDAHLAWAQTTSGLWQTTADTNGDVGGWVDWSLTTGGGTANWWERFIDTSAYHILAVNRWPLVDAPASPPPPPAPPPFRPDRPAAWPTPVAGDRLMLSVPLAGPVAELTVRVWDAAAHLTGRWVWHDVQPGDLPLALDGFARWAPGVYLAKVTGRAPDGGAVRFAPLKIVVKR